VAQQRVGLGLTASKGFVHFTRRSPSAHGEHRLGKEGGREGEREEGRGGTGAIRRACGLVVLHAETWEPTKGKKEGGTTRR
jgi:hypothetical protein